MHVYLLHDAVNLIKQGINCYGIFNAVRKYGSSLGLDLNPHALRKWCASYWTRKGEDGMVNFVLIHGSVNLKGRYVAPLTAEEVMGKQEIMENELIGK